MQTHDTTLPPDLDLNLVDLDDLRTAFGGQAPAVPVQETAAAAPTSTLMCPQW